MYVHVAIARKLAEHQDILTYHVPNQFEMQIHYGSMVAVPMGRGNQEVQGYVVDIVYDVPEGQYKEVISVPEPETLLNQELTELALWISQYYLCPCYYVLEYMLPRFARSKKTEVAVWNGDSDLTQAQMLFLEPDVQRMAAQIQSEKKIAVSRFHTQ